MVAFSSLARIWVERSSPALLVFLFSVVVVFFCFVFFGGGFFFLFFSLKWRLACAHTNSTLCARVSPQWLSELRRLWPNIP